MMRALVIMLVTVVVTTQAWAGEVVANRTLRAGTILGPGDLAPRGDGAQESIASLLGLEVRRAIYVGRVVLAEDLGPATLVRRNDVVTMVYRSGSLGLRTEGRALSAGGKGERIDVMNLDSRLTVRATVVSAGHVEIHR